jgi:hypothetical protein
MRIGLICEPYRLPSNVRPFQSRTLCIYLPCLNSCRINQ